MMSLPKLSEIPDDAFYCVECGPTNVGLDCDLPGHGEFALLADLPVRECPMCPTWVECAHFGDQCVRLSNGDVFIAYVEAHCDTGTNEFCAPYFTHRKRPSEWGATGPGVLLSRDNPLNLLCDGSAIIEEKNADYFGTEAEARAEFERRVALMLGREAE